jgi:hypothetical protein
MQMETNRKWNLFLSAAKQKRHEIQRAEALNWDLARECKAATCATGTCLTYGPGDVQAATARSSLVHTCWERDSRWHRRVRWMVPPRRSAVRKSTLRERERERVLPSQSASWSQVLLRQRNSQPYPLYLYKIDPLKISLPIFWSCRLCTTVSLLRSRLPLLKRSVLYFPLLKRFKGRIHAFHCPITRVPRSVENFLARQRHAFQRPIPCEKNLAWGLRAFHRPILLAPCSVSKKLALGHRASMTTHENFLTWPLAKIS